jgi:CBS domain-containing protein
MHGIVPIIDMARYYGFAAGSEAVNTRDRLEQAAESGKITEGQARDLLDTLDFLSGLRLQHQAHRMSDGQAADNYLDPATLSNFERGHLLEAFKLISRMQTVVAEAYPVNLL